MKIEIKNRFTGKVIISGDYESIKVLLENNREANLRYANLRGANLRDANLEGANLEGADLRGANLRYANLEGADLRGANLEDADLRYANLRYANLRDADLRGANLGGANLEGASLEGADLRDANLEDANLEGAENYDSSIQVFIEIIHRQDQLMFTQKEWATIGKGITNGVCWGNIKEKFGDTMYKIFKKLAKVGFDEWLKHWESLD